MAIPDDFEGQVVDLYRRVAELERRNRNASRVGTIASESDIDPEKGLARVTLTTRKGKPYKTGWLPWSEQAAGAAKTHFPPSAGQQVRVRSQSGDLSDAEIELSVPSDTNRRPSKRGDERVLLEYGATKVIATDGGKKLVFAVGRSSLEMTDAETVLKTPKFRGRRG